jgi:hypothetical protein
LPGRKKTQTAVAIGLRVWHKRLCPGLAPGVGRHVAIPLLYDLVKRHFGVWAGLIAALALAVMPVAVSTERNNTMVGAWRGKSPRSPRG